MAPQNGLAWPRPTVWGSHRLSLWSSRSQVTFACHHFLLLRATERCCRKGWWKPGMVTPSTGEAEVGGLGKQSPCELSWISELLLACQCGWKKTQEEKVREILVATRRKICLLLICYLRQNCLRLTIGMLLDFKISGVYLFYCIRLIYEKLELEVSRNNPLFQSEGSAFFSFLTFFLSSWPTWTCI